MAANDTSGRLKRAGRAIGRYGLRRIRSPELAEKNREMIRTGWRGALAALRPMVADRGEIRGGYEGRHSDGGRARFAELVRARKLDDEQLARIARGHLRASLVFGAAAAFLFLTGLVSMVRADAAIVLSSGLAIALFAGVFAAMAIRSDFSRWQVTSRRFGGFKEYLERRS